MELRAFAELVVFSEDIATKVRPIKAVWTDVDAGPARRPTVPERPASLRFAARRTAPGLPSVESLKDPKKRGLAHHILANHELQALESMAWVLLAFPEAPAEFRRGMADIMVDEQKHTRMHVERARMLGVEFGDFPVNGYIWNKVTELSSALEYCACLPLVFESRNLDHSLELAAAFDAAGDERSAALMRLIHREEIDHVRFGLDWLRRLKPQQLSEWDAFEQSLKFPLRPGKARGDRFQREARLAAGMSVEFVDRLEASED